VNTWKLCPQVATRWPTEIGGCKSAARAVMVVRQRTVRRIEALIG